MQHNFLRQYVKSVTQYLLSNISKETCYTLTMWTFPSILFKTEFAPFLFCRKNEKKARSFLIQWKEREPSIGLTAWKTKKTGLRRNFQFHDFVRRPTFMLADLVLISVWRSLQIFTTGINFLSNVFLNVHLSLKKFERLKINASEFSIIVGKIIHVNVLVLIAEGLQQADKLHVHLKQR